MLASDAYLYQWTEVHSYHICHPYGTLSRTRTRGSTHIVTQCFSFGDTATLHFVPLAMTGTTRLSLRRTKQSATPSKIHNHILSVLFYRLVRLVFFLNFQLALNRLHHRFLGSFCQRRFCLENTLECRINWHLH